MSDQPTLDEVCPFLDAIRALPDDDAPRLIFADWLEEHGDLERAGFIRLQCLAASTDDDETRWAAQARARRVRRAIGARLVDLPGIHVQEGRFHRGLLVNANSDMPAVWSIAPIRIMTEIRAEDESGWWSRIFPPGLLTGLVMTSPLTSVLELLLKSEVGASIRSLRLPPNHELHRSFRAKDVPLTATSIRALVSPIGLDDGQSRPYFDALGQAFPALVALKISKGSLPPSAAQAFAEAPWVDRLEELRLDVPTSIWAALIRSGRANDLRQLDFEFTETSEAFPDDWRAWSRLESVAIHVPLGDGTTPDLAAFQRLAAGLASLPALRTLKLTGNLDSRHLEALARAGGFPALRSLRFWGIGLRSMRPLLSASWMRQLAELWILGFRRGASIAGLDQWLNDPAKANLRRLGLHGLKLSDDQFDRLIMTPSLQDLIVLDLAGAQLGGGAAGQLAADHLPRLEMFELSRGSCEAGPPLSHRFQGPTIGLGKGGGEWWDYPANDWQGDPRTPWETLT